MEDSSWVSEDVRRRERSLIRLHGAENVFDSLSGILSWSLLLPSRKELKALADHPVIGMHRYMPTAGTAKQGG